MTRAAQSGAPAAFGVSVILYLTALWQARSLGEQPPIPSTGRGFVQDFLGRTATVRDAAPLLLENRTNLPLVGEIGRAHV